MQSFEGDRITSPSVGAKMWCLFFVFVLFMLRSETGALCVTRVHSSNMYCVTVCGSILMRFSAFFFGRDRTFRGTTYFSFPSLDGATIFAKLRYKIAKST